MWRYCICILVRSTLRFSTPFPAHQTSDMRECRLSGLGIDRYSCQFGSGLDKICLYLSLYFIYAVTYPMLKKKIIIATTKLLNDDYNWLIIRFFLYTRVCANLNWYEKFIFTHLWYCTNTDTYRFCFHFLVIFIYDNNLCRLVISVLYL